MRAVRKSAIDHTGLIAAQKAYIQSA